MMATCLILLCSLPGIQVQERGAPRKAPGKDGRDREIVWAFNLFYDRREKTLLPGPVGPSAKPTRSKSLALRIPKPVNSTLQIHRSRTVLNDAKRKGRDGSEKGTNKGTKTRADNKDKQDSKDKKDHKKDQGKGKKDKKKEKKAK